MKQGGPVTIVLFNHIKEFCPVIVNIHRSLAVVIYNFVFCLTGAQVLLYCFWPVPLAATPLTNQP